MSNFDDYITAGDKPFCENINDALLLSNVFDLTVPIQVPTMFRNSAWIDVTDSRKCGVAILTLKESLPSGVSISTVDGKSVLTGTGTVKLGFYPNFNSFGSFKSIDWEETGTVQINLKTVDNTIIASNISKGLIQNPSQELRTLQEIVLEIVLNNGTLKSLDVVLENKQQERYGAEVGIDDVNGLDDRLDAIESDINGIVDLIYPVGSIYMSVNSTSPATLFGGTWEQLKDKFLLSAGDTYSAGATGGSAAVSLTKSQMPRHTHIQNSHNHTQNGHTHSPTGGRKYVAIGDVNWGYSAKATVSTSTKSYYYPHTDADTGGITEQDVTTSTTATNQSSTAVNKYTGGTATTEAEQNGSAHENMPPYLAVYVWKRTA